MGKKNKRVALEGDSELGNNPFGGLDLGPLPSAPQSSVPVKKPDLPKKSRGRVDVRREKSGRGGKTVTLIYGFKGISAEEKASLAKSIQKSCGVGGGVKDGNIEIQGDKREEAQVALEKAGFQVVFTGG